MARPTIDDVARIAGVSIATVSRTLSNPDVVSERSRKIVMDAINQTGYTQNVAAQNLRQQRSNAVLVLVPDIGNTYFSAILAGIERAASKARMTILIGDTAGSEEREEEFLRYLVNGRADGALLLNGHLPGSLRARLETGGVSVPLVSVSEALDAPGVPHVGINNVLAARQATEHLLSLGHKKIVHLAGPGSNILTRDRNSGYQAAMGDAGLTATILEGDFSIESGERAASVLLSMPMRPTAVFCASDEMAMGLISALYSQGIKVPDDLSVLGFDDIIFGSAYIPALSTIRQPRHMIGEVAMEKLVGLMGGGIKAASEAAPDATSLRGGYVTLLPTELVLRKSTQRLQESS